MSRHKEVLEEPYLDLSVEKPKVYGLENTPYGYLVGVFMSQTKNGKVERALFLSDDFEELLGVLKYAGSNGLSGYSPSWSIQLEIRTTRDPRTGVKSFNLRFPSDLERNDGDKHQIIQIMCDKGFSHDPCLEVNQEVT